MALGEYVSVSSQRDSQRTEIAQEKRELAATPEAELTELTALYEAKGLSAATARTVAAELTAHGAPAAHLDAELHIDPEDIPSAVQAAAASALSFTSGALLPLLAILLPPASAASGTYSAPPSADANRAPGASRRKCQRADDPAASLALSAVCSATRSMVDLGRLRADSRADGLLAVGGASVQADGLAAGNARLRQDPRRGARVADPGHTLAVAHFELPTALAEHPGARPGQLAQLLNMRPNTVTTIVNADRAGNAVRAAAVGDRRAVELNVTEAGRQAVLAWQATNAAVLHLALSTLPARQRRALAAAAPTLDALARAVHRLADTPGSLAEREP